MAQAWLETLAPDPHQVTVRETLPEAAGDLSDDQRAYLAALAEAAVEQSPDAGDAWQDLIFRTAQRRGSPPAGPSRPCTRRSLVEPMGPAQAGCWRASSGHSRFARLREAALAGATA